MGHSALLRDSPGFYRVDGALQVSHNVSVYQLSNPVSKCGLSKPLSARAKNGGERARTRI